MDAARQVRGDQLGAAAQPELTGLGDEVDEGLLEGSEALGVGRDVEELGDRDEEEVHRENAARDRRLHPEAQRGPGDREDPHARERDRLAAAPSGRDRVAHGEPPSSVVR